MLNKLIHFFICLIVFSLPLYLVRFEIGWVPTNLLELMICGLFFVWLLKQGQSLSVKETVPVSMQIPILLIFLGVTISTIFSTDIQTSAGIWKGWFVVPLLFFIVFIDSIKTKKQIRDILGALTLSGFAVAIIALWYWFSGNLTFDSRLKAFYLSPNHLAMYLSPILILSFYLYAFAKRKISKISLFIVLCSLFTVIYLTYSYGAWLGLLGAFAFVFIVSRCWKLNFQCLVGLLLLLIILAFIFQFPSAKFQGFLDFSYPSLQSRIVIWQSAWEIIKKYPLIGVGPGMFQKYYLDFQSRFEPYPEWAVPQPHNIFLAFWLQTGLLGLIGFIWLLIAFFIKGTRHLTIQNSKFKIQNSILVAAMVYILIHGLVDTTFWKNDLSIIFWLLIALSCIRDRLSC